MSSQRHYSPIDRLLLQADAAMRTLIPNSSHASRPSPAVLEPHSTLDAEQTRHVAGLMRINHTGEVCAQGLYKGQALTASLPQVREQMELAAEEEVDHLVWCEQRIRELGSQPSLLNPLFMVCPSLLGPRPARSATRSVSALSPLQKSKCASTSMNICSRFLTQTANHALF